MSNQAFTRHQYASIVPPTLLGVRPADAFGLRGDGVRLGLAWFIGALLSPNERKSLQLSAPPPFNNPAPTTLGILSRRPAFMRYRARQVSSAQRAFLGGGMLPYGLGDTHASSATLGKAGLWAGICAITERNQHRVLISWYGRTRAA